LAIFRFPRSVGVVVLDRLVLRPSSQRLRPSRPPRKAPIRSSACVGTNGRPPGIPRTCPAPGARRAPMSRRRAMFRCAAVHPASTSGTTRGCAFTQWPGAAALRGDGRRLQLC